LGLVVVFAWGLGSLGLVVDWVGGLAAIVVMLVDNDRALSSVIERY
jgi:phage-related minor tail protein